MADRGGRSPFHVTRDIAVLAACLWLSGCATHLPAPHRGEAMRNALASTVQLRCEREPGVRRVASGVVLAVDTATRRGFVLTTRHFLEPSCRELGARLPGRKERIAATLAASDHSLDLALLEVEGLDRPAIRLQDHARLGDGVLVVAFPWGRQMTAVSGVVSQIGAEEGEEPAEGPVRMIDASVSQGSSGGGVFDAATGALVGIVEGYRTARVSTREAPSTSLEIPVAGETLVIAVPQIRRFLERSGLDALATP